MLELIIQIVLSVLCVFGAFFIIILIYREISCEKNGKIVTAVITKDGRGIEKTLEKARKYYGVRVCIIADESIGEKKLAELSLRHPRTAVYQAKLYKSKEKANGKRRKRRSMRNIGDG